MLQSFSYEGTQNIFHRKSRNSLLIGFINQSINIKQYSVAYEVTKRFLSDLLKASHLPIFDTLLSHFKDDPTRYDAKLALML